MLGIHLILTRQNPFCVKYFLKERKRRTLCTLFHSKRALNHSFADNQTVDIVGAGRRALSII